jgi:hypothetical protein
MTEDHQMNERGKAWIKAIHAAYQSTPMAGHEVPANATVAEVGNFKIL